MPWHTYRTSAPGIAEDHVQSLTFGSVPCGTRAEALELARADNRRDREVYPGGYWHGVVYVEAERLPTPPPPRARHYAVHYGGARMFVVLARDEAAARRAGRDEFNVPSTRLAVHEASADEIDYYRQYRGTVTEVE